jgi:hypothetical protein
MKILRPVRRLIGVSELGVHGCPDCASEDIRLSRKQHPLYKLFGFARYRCQNCDATWRRLVSRNQKLAIGGAVGSCLFHRCGFQIARIRVAPPQVATDLNAVADG